MASGVTMRMLVRDAGRSFAIDLCAVSSGRMHTHRVARGFVVQFGSLAVEVDMHACPANHCAGMQ